MEIFDKSSLWYKSYYRERDIKQSVSDIIEISKANPTDRFLDLGCGAGDIAAEIDKRGYRIRGIDPSQKMIDIAKSQKTKVIFTRGKLEDISKGDFEILFGYFHVINYAVHGGKLMDFLKQLETRLSDNSKAIFDFWNYDVVEKDGLSNVSKEFLIGDKVFIRKVAPLLKGHDVELRIEVEEKENQRMLSCEQHYLGLFSEEQLKDTVRRIGLNLQLTHWPSHVNNTFSSVAVISRKEI